MNKPDVYSTGVNAARFAWRKRRNDQRSRATRNGCAGSERENRIPNRSNDASYSVVPQATPAAAQTIQTALQTEVGVFGKLVLVSWLNDDGKDVIFVKNIETNDVQQITSQSNIDNLRIVEIHPNVDRSSSKR